MGRGAGRSDELPSRSVRVRYCFSVALHEPRSNEVLDALVRHLEASGIHATVELLDPSPVSERQVLIGPFASLRLELHDGSNPSKEVAQQAFTDACGDLHATFGEVRLSLHGTGVGSFSDN